MKLKWLAILCVALFSLPTASASAADKPDPNFYIYLCFGQSNMEGFPTIEPRDRTGADDRFEVLQAVNAPRLQREKGKWYPANAPICRQDTGVCPVDYFGRTLEANLPKNIRIGVINVAVAGCKIELFQKDAYQAYAATAAPWMKNIIKQYDGNPYQYLVDMGKLAQKNGVIKGILLHQGESNNGDKQWPTKVKGIYDDLLKDLNLKAQDTPLLVGELVNADEHGSCAGMNAIIDKINDTIPTAYSISSSKCPGRPDGLHFTPAGYREFGKRYAQKELDLLGVKPTTFVDPTLTPAAH
jgi:hypothetical protein